MKPAAVIALARDAGYGERMIFRARAALDGRIEDTLGRRKTGNCWRLKEQARRSVAVRQSTRARAYPRN